MAYINKRKNKYYVIGSQTVNGKRKRVYLNSFDTKEEAEVYRLSYEKDKINGVAVIPTRKTFKEFMEEYTAYMSVEHWSLNTQRLNSGLVDKHVLPKIGHLTLKDIKPSHIANMMTDIRKTTKERSDGKELLSNKTVQLIYDIVNGAFKYAVEQEYVSANPVKISRPQNKKEADIRSSKKDWSEKDIADILQKENKNMMELFIELMFLGSLRESETAAIEIKNIDFENKRIIIENIIGRVENDKINTPKGKSEIVKVFDKATEESKSTLVLKAPKTKNAKRFVMLTDSVIRDIKKRLSEIEEAKAVLKDKYHDNGLLFTNNNGTPLENRNIQDRFKKWQEKYITPDGRKLPIVTPYRLRHYSCTAKLKFSNNDVKAVQRDMGVASPEMIHRVYSMMEEESSSVTLSQTMEEVFMNTSSDEEENTKVDIDGMTNILIKYFKNNPEKKMDFITKIINA